MPVLEASALTRIYRRGGEDVRAVDGVSLSIEKGETVALVGPSGSGKTTLLNMLGCLDNPTSGELRLRGETVVRDGMRMPEGRLTAVRRRNFGYVFQKFYLVPTLTVRENVLLPCVFFGGEGAHDRADSLLDLLGLAKRASHLPSELSGGEMQRAAIARALINEPPILMADEPTGNLDSKRSDEIRDTLLSINRERGVTILLVTHNPALAAACGRVVEMRDGRLAA